MATLKDIARVLADKHKMKHAAAEEFLNQLIELINEGLQQDRIVKIKGFGTFKMTEVKERNSVNVNTGEHLVIAAHDRVTFTPDSVMRDMVNKPFAHFDTVIISADSTEKKTEGNKVEETKAEKEKEVETPVVIEEETPVATIEDIPVSVEEEMPAVVEPTPEKESEESKKELLATPNTEENETETDTMEAAAANIVDNIAEVAENNVEGNKVESLKLESEEENIEEESLMKKIVTNIIVATVFFAIGCFVGNLGFIDSADTEKKEVVNKAVENKDDGKKTVEDKTEAVKAEASKLEVVKEDVKKAQSEDADYSVYNKDPRVKYGAYNIVGIDQVVTVREGQSLKGISRAYLGPDMECYVEALNGVKTVKAGDKIKIPKLQVKKVKK